MKVATRAIAVIGQMQPLGVSPDLPDFPPGAQMISGVEEARRSASEECLVNHTPSLTRFVNTVNR